MSKFRKKPTIVDAVQWFPGVPVDGVITLRGEIGIETLEGFMRVREGDWIITGVRGEKYACKPDIFAETYEPIE